MGRVDPTEARNEIISRHWTASAVRSSIQPIGIKSSRSSPVHELWGYTLAQILLMGAPARADDAKARPNRGVRPISPHACSLGLKGIWLAF
jgi:hypothetical protein